MGEGTKEVKFATVDDIREMIEMMVLLQAQIDNLQKQIEILTAKSIEEVNTIVGKRVADAKNRLKEDPNVGLEALHKMALEVPGHSGANLDNDGDDGWNKE